MLQRAWDVRVYRMHFPGAVYVLLEGHIAAAGPSYPCFPAGKMTKGPGLDMVVLAAVAHDHTPVAAVVPLVMGRENAHTIVAVELDWSIDRASVVVAVGAETVPDRTDRPVLLAPYLVVLVDK